MGIDDMKKIILAIILTGSISLSQSHIAHIVSGGTTG